MTDAAVKAHQMIQSCKVVGGLPRITDQSLVRKDELLSALARWKVQYEKVQLP